jgi:glycosyltransferase involved in cell wall biosynthesis
MTTLCQAGFDVTSLQPAPRCNREARRQLRILAAADLQSGSGLECFIDACALLRDRGHEFRADIVGAGDLYPILRARIDTQSLTGRVVLRGEMSADELLEEYQAADIFASVAQGTAEAAPPLELLAAMAMRLAVVSTSTAASALRHGYNGLLVGPQDPAGLASAIAHLLNDQPLRMRFGANARNALLGRCDPARMPSISVPNPLRGSLCPPGPQALRISA